MAGITDCDLLSLVIVQFPFPAMAVVQLHGHMAEFPESEADALHAVDGQ